MSDQSRLPEPWQELRGDDPGGVADRAGIEAELRRELSPAHPLSGRAFAVAARSTTSDDVLLALEPDGWAVVHLTWRGVQEEPPSPHTVIRASLNDLSDDSL